MSITSEHTRKLRVGILFGGKSAEHEVSVQSARNILEALDKNKFDPMLIGIDKQGRWKLYEPNQSPEKIVSITDLPASHLGLSLNSSTKLIARHAQEPVQNPDVIFPVLHGPHGEDGAIQGLLEIADIPYVGAGIAGSAVGMDKDIMKRLLHEAGLPLTEHIVLKNTDTIDPQKIIAALGTPLFVKPANMGSSIGVSKVKNDLELERAIKIGFQYDRKILIEKAVDGDEVECAVLGNEHPIASTVGRIVFTSGFYSYNAKYDAANDTTLEIPARLSNKVTKQVQQVALKTYAALECEGMARVDMFVTKQGKVIVNEINTLPGFTKFSMYPQLWQASGLSYTNLITKLLELAIDRHSKRQALLATRDSASIGENPE